jgi:hypothetical protein
MALLSIMSRAVARSAVPLASVSFASTMRPLRFPLYPNVSVADMTTMIQPVQAIHTAIEAKDRTKFENAFEKVTSACNSCHKAVGLDFIEIRVPLTSPMMTSPFRTPTRKVLCVVLGHLDQFLRNIKGPTPQLVQHRFSVKGQRLKLDAKIPDPLNSTVGGIIY